MKISLKLLSTLLLVTGMLGIAHSSFAAMQKISKAAVSGYISGIKHYLNANDLKQANEYLTTVEQNGFMQDVKALREEYNKKAGINLPAAPVVTMPEISKPLPVFVPVTQPQQNNNKEMQQSLAYINSIIAKAYAENNITTLNTYLNNAKNAIKTFAQKYGTENLNGIVNDFNTIVMSNGGLSHGVLTIKNSTIDESGKVIKEAVENNRTIEAYNKQIKALTDNQEREAAKFDKEIKNLQDAKEKMLQASDKEIAALFTKINELAPTKTIAQTSLLKYEDDQKTSTQATTAVLMQPDMNIDKVIPTAQLQNFTLDQMNKYVKTHQGKAILGLPETASKDDINKAFMALGVKFQPAYNGNSPVAKEIMNALDNAKKESLNKNRPS